MNLIITLSNLFALLILGLSFVRYNLAIVLYLAYMLLIPNLYVDLPVVDLLHFTLNAIMFGILIFKFRIKNSIPLDFGTTMPFIFLLISLLLLTMFAEMVSPSYQLYSWVVDLMTVWAFATIIWNVAINDDSFIINSKRSLIIAILIAGTYATLIMNLDGANPYTAVFSSHLDQKDSTEAYITMDRIRNQGTMLHPFTWVFYLSLLCYYFFILFLKERKLLYLLLVCFVAFNIIIADVRTGLASVIIALAYVFFRYENKIKVFFWGTAVIIIIVSVVASNEELSERFLSMIDVSGTQTSVEGSSFQMRMNQFYGCLDEISRAPMGHGYAWTGYYLSQFEIHPVILGFESLIYVVLCNHGIAGIVIWSIFIIMLFRVPRKILVIKKNMYCMDGLLIFFLIYTIATGLFQWLAPFALFYSLTLGYLCNKEKKEITLI